MRIDVVELYGGAYWRKLKQRLTGEGSEVVTFCHGLKLEAEDGKLLAELYNSTWCSGCINWVSAQQDKSWRCACSKLQNSKSNATALPLTS